MSINEILSLAGQMILSLSILVVLHECGHFFPAKWFKTKVEKFYLFFDPYFSLFKVKKGETEYGIGWIPFGGYVKIAGMIDESMDKEQMKLPPQPWEFRSKKAWQRLIIMIGGVVVNFILGFFLFAMVLFTWGREYFKNADVKYGIATDDLGYKLGLRDGDKIVSIGSNTFQKFNPGILTKEVVLNNATEMKVDRNGEVITLQFADSLSKTLTTSENKEKSIFSLRFPQLVDTIEKKTLAEKMNLKRGDKILSINNNSNVFYAHEFNKAMKSNAGNNIALKVLRGADTLALNGKLDSTGKLGVYLTGPEKFLTVSTEHFTFTQAIPEGVHTGVGFLSDQIKAFKQMFKGKVKAKDNLGSIFSIAKMFDPKWSWQKFWTITAMLSIILAFFNILPIPALDGGYVLFLLIEVFTGKKFSDKFMEYVTMAGFIILMTLMIFALGLDVTRMFK